MAMLDVLHKVTFDGVAAQLMPFLSATALRISSYAYEFERQRLRHWRLPHAKQILVKTHFQLSIVLLRSNFVLVVCYNKLPQRFVDTKIVKSFQRELQLALQNGANSGLPG